MRPVQFLLLPCVLFALAKVIRVYKQQGMRTIEFLLWALVWIGSGFIVAFPDAASFLAHIGGIGRGADLIIYTSLLVVFYLIFRIHLMLDRLEQEVTEIVRTIALERLTEPKEPSLGERQ
jgi:small membrane protein